MKIMSYEMPGSASSHPENKSPHGYWLSVAREHGIKPVTYNNRCYKYGWPPAKAAMHPVIVAPAERARAVRIGSLVMPIRLYEICQREDKAALALFADARAAGETAGVLAAHWDVPIGTVRKWSAKYGPFRAKITGIFP